MSLEPQQAVPIPRSQAELGNEGNGEVYRKLLHMFPGVLPLTLSAIPHPDPLDALALAIVAGITLALTVLFLASFRLVRRPGEDNLLSTALSYPAVVLLTLFLFPGAVELTCVVVVVLAFGDGSACIGGRLLGRRPLPWNPSKTWAGTISFVIVAAPLAALAYWLEASQWGRAAAGAPIWIAALCGSAAAIAGAAAESLPTRLTDNLRVGLAALAAAVAVHLTLGGGTI